MSMADDSRVPDRTNFLLNYPGKSLRRLSWTGLITKELIDKVLSFPALKTLIFKDVAVVPEEFRRLLEEKGVEFLLYP